MFRASSAHHQESLTVHTASRFWNLNCFKWVLNIYVECIQHSFKTILIPETGGCMYGEELLMMSAWRSKHVELYTYRRKIKIYHKLHLLVYLLECCVGFNPCPMEINNLVHFSFLSALAYAERFWNSGAQIRHMSKQRLVFGVKIHKTT
jgi:hypothetical protein